MSFRNWFSGKKALDLSKRSQAVQSLMKKSIAYLRKRAEENPKAQIRPAMLAEAIGENEMIALTALSMLEKAGIVHAHIGLYCSTTMQWLGEADPGRPIPESLPCDACMREVHDLDSGTMQKELFFTFVPGAMAEVKEAA